MKLKLIQLFVFLLISTNLLSQEVLDTDQSKENNIYLESLKKYCDSLSSDAKLKIYVEFNKDSMSYWPEKINETEIQYIYDIKDYKQVLKENKNSVLVVKILPLQYKKEKFFVSIIPFLAEHKNKKINKISGGGYAYQYLFNTEKKGFIFDKTISFLL